jgi:hypothetical protein
MTQPPPPLTAPDPDRIEIDGGEPNGYVVVALDRDVDPDPARDLADVLAASVVAPAPARLLALLAALGDPPTRRLVSARARDAVQQVGTAGEELAPATCHASTSWFDPATRIGSQGPSGARPTARNRNVGRWTYTPKRGSVTPSCAASAPTRLVIRRCPSTTHSAR